MGQSGCLCCQSALVTTTSQCRSISTKQDRDSSLAKERHASKKVDCVLGQRLYYPGPMLFNVAVRERHLHAPM